MKKVEYGKSDNNAPPRRAGRNGLLIRLKKGLGEFERSCFPFHLFSDCRIGPVKTRAKAFKDNQEKKPLILPYIGMWILRSIAMLMAMFAFSAQRPVAETWFVWFETFLALCFCFSAISSVLLVVIYLGLTFLKEEKELPNKRRV